MAIQFSRDPTGSVGLGLFLVALSSFALSTLAPLFGPSALVSVGGGALLAVVRSRRRPRMLHIDPRHLDQPD